MLISASEGEGFRYEVAERTDGFLVQTRDTDTGEVEEGETRLFRTAAVAFAYAELLVTFNRFAAAQITGEAGTDLLQAELGAQEALYTELSRRLRDEGLAAQFMLAWEAADTARERRRLH
jgi:hypothetical protein